MTSWAHTEPEQPRVWVEVQGWDAHGEVASCDADGDTEREAVRIACWLGGIVEVGRVNIVRAR